ncbi:hypothetical protein M1590_03960 [Candidatus Marsarchaeota archaeon]|nr:hypothetical protein [Candidatus Marsarchaeota archaeon]
MLDTALIIAITLIAAAIVAYAQYIFKKGVHRFALSPSGIYSLARNRKVIEGALIYLAGLAVYLVALGSGSLSLVYPAFSSTFIFVILISHFVFRERIGYARLAGILIIIVGIALVSGIL